MSGLSSRGRANPSLVRVDDRQTRRYDADSSVKPLSNLDYLIRRGDDFLRPSSSPEPPSPTAGDSALEEAVVALATPVLRALADAGGRSSVFQLVDRLQIRASDLRPVLDNIARRFHWIEVGQIDLKGDDPVTLTEKGQRQIVQSR